MSSIGGPGGIYTAPPGTFDSTPISSGELSQIKSVAANEMRQQMTSLSSLITTNGSDLASLMTAMSALKSANETIPAQDMERKLAEMKEKLAAMERELKAGAAPPPDPRVAGLMKQAEGLKKMLASMPTWFPVRPMIQAQLNNIQNQIDQLTPKAPSPGGPKLDPRILDMMKAADGLRSAIAVLPPFARPILQAQLAMLEKQIAGAKAASAPPPPTQAKNELEAAAAALRKQIEALTSTLAQQTAKLNSMVSSMDQIMAQMMQSQQTMKDLINKQGV